MQINEADIKKQHAAKFSIISNSGLILLKVAVGMLTLSVSIIAEAIHSGIDLIAAFIANYSVKKSGEPADSKHPFGHGRVEDISALIEGILILFAAYLILHEAYDKFVTGIELTKPGVGVFIMLLSSVSNWLISGYLFRVSKETGSAALEADAWHLRTDVYTSLGVFAGLSVIALNEFLGGPKWVRRFDPAIAALTALMIVKAGWDISKTAVMNLADLKISDNEELAVKQAIEENSDRYVEFHELRTRRAGPFRYIDLHLVVSRDLHVETAHKLTDHLEEDIKAKLPHTDVIIHLEPCEGNCEACHIKCPTHAHDGDLK